jgi:hemerythrin-like domain-containing protein
VFFARIRERTHDADAVLDQLGREHAAGERAIRDLEQAFVRYQERGAAEFPAFAAAADAYVGHYLEHMLKEEREVIPIANRVLTDDDWAAVEAAFAAHRDPLAGASPNMDMDKLFSRIVMLVPAPYGVGAPLQP